MGFFERYVIGRESRWKWFGLTVLGGFIPVITTLIFAGPTEPRVKIVDIVFLGLTMNISNLNLVGGLNFELKDVMVLLSITFMVILCLCLGKVYSNVELVWWLKFGIWMIALTSVCMNFEVNNFVFKHVIKK